MIRVGVAGWAYADWEGIVYPVRKPRGFDPLGFLAGFFDTIEINSSFYRIPRPDVAAGWAKRVADRGSFRFTVKLHRSFTHDRENLREEDVSAFRRALEPLAGAGILGAVLAQFPYSFRPGEESLAILDSIREAFREHPLVVEIRRAEWAGEELFGFLRDRKIGFCNIDQPAVSRSLGPTEEATSSVGYVRLHGRNAEEWFREGREPFRRYDYLYAEEELAPWVGRIGRIAEQTADVFIIANNHYRGKGPLAALTLLAMITGRPVAAPPDLAAAYPQAASRLIREAPRQPGLFEG